MPTAKRASADAHVHVRVDDYGLGSDIIWEYAPTSVHSSQCGPRPSFGLETEHQQY